MFFVMQKAWPVIAHNGIRLITTGGWDQQVNDAWAATEPHWRYGALPLVVGTLITTTGALIITALLGLGTAIFLAELAPARLRKPVESVVRLLAGIPSVVFGLIGLMVVVPFIQNKFVPDALALKYANIVPLDGYCLSAGIVVLSFMILPFFVTVATDALNAVPRTYKEGSLALGLSHWRTITRAMIPIAAPGIIAGIILAAARAIGEAIALSMITGSVGFLPSLKHGLVFFLEPVRTLAAAIVENGEGFGVNTMDYALFSLGTLLLFFSLILSLSARLIFKWFQKKMMVRS